MNTKQQQAVALQNLQNVHLNQPLWSLTAFAALCFLTAFAALWSLTAFADLWSLTAFADLWSLTAFAALWSLTAFASSGPRTSFKTYFKLINYFKQFMDIDATQNVPKALNGPCKKFLQLKNFLIKKCRKTRVATRLRLSNQRKNQVKKNPSSARGKVGWWMKLGT